MNSSSSRRSNHGRPPLDPKVLSVLGQMSRSILFTVPRRPITLAHGAGRQQVCYNLGL